MSSTSHTPIDLADRADAAVHQLFGHDAALTRTISQITDSLREDAARIKSGSSAGPISIALVGRVGEGKSWLTRAFIDDNASTAEVLNMIQSGQNAAERSMELTWIGYQQPFAKLSDRERFFKLSPNHLLDLGVPYLVADSPGYSDHDPSLEALSSVALTSSHIKLLLTSDSHIRDAALASFVQSMDGSIILPVIRYRPENTDDLTVTAEVQNDCQAEMLQWKSDAPAAHILPPIFIPDAGISGESAARNTARQAISASLTPLISDSENLTRHRESQLQQRIQRTRTELTAALTDFRQRLGTPVEKLDQLAATLPDIVQKEVIGDTAQLNIGIRSRFRADAIERTPALLFPYRPLIGILGLTQGAWDRLIFTTLGSIPSLIMTGFHSVRSWTKTKDFETTLRDQSRQRLRSLINDAYRDDIKNFSRAIDSITNDENSVALAEQTDIIDIQGLTGLEIEAQEIISKAINKRRLSGFTLWFGGLSVFLIFWLILLGPAIALYTDYFLALGETAKSFSQDWQQYPKPPASLWLTSMMLAMIPAGLISMLVMLIISRKSRVRKASNDIQTQLAATIKQRIQDDKLRLVINNPKLNAAKSLLGI